MHGFISKRILLSLPSNVYVGIEKRALPKARNVLVL